jgi:fimbrial chaperone protein
MGVNVRSLILGTLASAAAFGLSPAPVHAGTFSVSPLRVELSSKVQTGALTIRNREDTPVLVQAECFLWEQVDGQDRLVPTRDVLVSPAVFTLPAEGSQLVRVALRRPADAQRELAYRLILTEVPPEAKPGFTGLSVALRLSLPIFVEALAPAEPRLEWSVARDGDGRLALTARNAGAAHARVLNFSVAPVAVTGVVLDQPVSAYILPDQARTWTLDNNQNDGNSGTDWRQLRVKAATEAGDLEAEASLDHR